MMYKVIKRFRDRLDGKIYEVNDEYIPKNKERAKELIKLGYIKEVKQPKTKKKSEKK